MDNCASTGTLVSSATAPVRSVTSISAAAVPPSPHSTVTATPSCTTAIPPRATATPSTHATTTRSSMATATPSSNNRKLLDIACDLPGKFNFEVQNTQPISVELPEPNCHLLFYLEFITKSCNDYLLDYTTGEEVLWEATNYKKWGEIYLQQRLHFAQVDARHLEHIPIEMQAAASYSYQERKRRDADRTFTRSEHATRHRLRPMSPVFHQVCDGIFEHTRYQCDSIFGSAQPCGASFMGAHSDSEEMYHKFCIGDLSLGPGTRYMRISHKTIPWSITIPLEPRSFLAMIGPDFQKYFVHEILPSKDDTPRIALITRLVHHVDMPQPTDLVNTSLVAEGVWNEMVTWLKDHLQKQEVKRKEAAAIRRANRWYVINVSFF